MLVDTRPTVQFPRFVPGQRETFSGRPEKAIVNEAQIKSSSTAPDRVGFLRTLAGQGRLADVAASAGPMLRTELSGAAFSVAWPIVFVRLTRGLELRRAHAACATSVFRMADECLDRFYDDVEAVVDDVLAHATTPIRNLEAWIATRLNAATVDGHRRRRGQRGALQRPRLPKWLSASLGEDPWLMELATQILLWVGVSATAGAEVWPLDGWAVRRATVTGDRVHSDPALVAREVGTVLTAMRTKPSWFADHVERPFGHKQAPVVSANSSIELPPLLLADRAALDDAHLADLASEALEAIQARLRRGQDVMTAVTEVIHVVFGVDVGGHDIDCPPLVAPDYEERVAAVLGDSTQVERVVAAVLRIVTEPSAVVDGTVAGRRIFGLE